MTGISSWTLTRPFTVKPAVKLAVKPACRDERRRQNPFYSKGAAKVSMHAMLMLFPKMYIA